MSMTRAGTVAVAVGLALLMLVALGAPPASAELKVSVGGYVKLDLEYQDRITSAGLTRALPAPADVPFTTGPNKDLVKSRNDQFILDAKETRFNINATDKVGDVDLKGYIEVDFFGGTDSEVNSLVSNAGVVRLRHAIGQGTMPLGIGKLTLLAGQFWHAFGYLSGPISRPPTVSFSSTPGLFSREPQVKLTYAIPYGKDTLNLIGAVSPNAVNFLRSTATLTGTTSADPARQEGENVPSFTVKAQWLGSVLQAEVAGIFTSVKGIDSLNGAGQRDSEFGYGVQGTAAVTVGPVRVAGHADNLHGLNRHSTASFSDAVFVSGVEDSVRLIDTVGLWGGASYKLTPTTSFNGIYDIRWADSSGFSGFGRGTNAQTDLVRQQALRVNLLQQFWKRFQFGLEFERKWKDAFRNNHGSQNLYHAAFWYFF